MTRITFAVAAACAVVATTLAAQTTTPQPPPAPALRTDTAQTMTLTGCLKPWDPATMGVGGISGASGMNAAQQYVLIDAETSAAGAPGAGSAMPGAAQPPAGTTPVMGAHSTYLLKPSSAVTFSGFVNQKVQVMGTLAVDPTLRPGTPGVTGMGTASTPTTTGGTGTPTTSSGGTPTTTAGGTPTTSTGGTPTTSTAATGTGTMGTGTTSAAAMSQKAGAAATQSTFTVSAISMVAKTCS